MVIQASIAWMIVKTMSSDRVFNVNYDSNMVMKKNYKWVMGMLCGEQYKSNIS